MRTVREGWGTAASVKRFPYGKGGPALTAGPTTKAGAGVHACSRRAEEVETGRSRGLGDVRYPVYYISKGQAGESP